MLKALKFTVIGWIFMATLDLALSQEKERSGMAGREPPIVIAHRGASGYVAEHTEAAKVLAIAQGADYVEQDLVLSKDLQLIVAHDIHLDATTNAAELYPERKRQDGKFYYADFTWEELRKMSVFERTAGKPPYQGRFDQQLDQTMMRMVDEIKLVQGLNRTLRRDVGLHVELKRPEWHVREFGIHPSDKLLPILRQAGYSNATDRCFIQCFEASELKYLRSAGCKLQLVQLYGSQPIGLLEKNGLQGIDGVCAELTEVAKYADGIGPPLKLLVTTQRGHVTASPLAKIAHELGLVVHPYTVRADQLPSWADSIDGLHRALLIDQKVDGFFTDFPDLGRQAVDTLSSSR